MIMAYMYRNNARKDKAETGKFTRRKKMSKRGLGEGERERERERRGVRKEREWGMKEEGT